MSKNWLTIFSEGKAAVPEKKAQLAARQDDFARKVEQLRKVTGKAETRRMHCVCANTSGGFTVQFERTNPKEHFRIARIEKDQARASGASGVAASQEQVLDGDDFDTRSFQCAYCGTLDFVHCEWCGANVCMGRTRRLPDGSENYRCRDGCAATGELVPYDKVHAEENQRGRFAARRPAADSISALPARPVFPALPPAGGAPRLSGPRR